MPVSQTRDKATLPDPASARLHWNWPASYARLHGGFVWQVPELFNMAQACCVRWSEQSDASKRIAVCAYQTGTKGTFYTYKQLQIQANQLANVLAALGVQAGDRVAIVLPQRFETAVAYMAVLQMGAVAMPLSQLFGPEALEFRLQDSEAVVALGDAQTLTGLNAVRQRCPSLRQVIGIGQPGGDQAQADVDYTRALLAASDQFTLVATRADAPAILIYTSGTTGNPKGALIPHRALIGNLTGFLCSQNGFGFDMTAIAEPVAGLCQLANANHLPTQSDAVF